MSKSARRKYFDDYREQLSGDQTSFTAAVEEERRKDMAKAVKSQQRTSVRKTTKKKSKPTKKKSK